jgi:hypothetical protein
MNHFNFKVNLDEIDKIINDGETEESKRDNKPRVPSAAQKQRRQWNKTRSSRSRSRGETKKTGGVRVAKFKPASGGAVDPILKLLGAQ